MDMCESICGKAEYFLMSLFKLIDLFSNVRAYIGNADPMTINFSDTLCSPVSS